MRGGSRGGGGHRNINTRQTWRPGVIDPVIGDPLMQILRPSSPFAPSLPPFPSPPSFPSLYRYNSTKPPIKAADRRSRNPRTERRITCEARRRGYVSVSEKPVDHLRGSVKLEIICPFPSTIPACLAIIGEHRRERASRKSRPEPRKGPKRTRANGEGEREGGE